MSWHVRISEVQGNSENLGGNVSRIKKTVTANNVGLKRSALGEIGNKVVSRSNSSLATKPGALKNDIVKPLQRTVSLRSVGTNNAPKADFVKPLPKVNVTNRVKRTFSNTSVVSVCLPTNKADAVKEVQPTTTKTDFEDVDKADESNPLLVANYAFEIYEYLLSLEDKFPIRENFLEGQQVAPRMRTVLVDWLVDVQLQYHLLQETLYLAVSILDRYLQAVPTVPKKYLQLVGVAAMFVASKYEEVYMPDISDFVFITDSAYTKQQLLGMETKIVKALDFQFSRPISLTFLRRYSKVVEAHPMHHCLSKYFLELAMLEYSLCHVKPSLTAAAALYISLCLYELNDKKGPDHWDAKMVHYSSYTLDDIKPVAQTLATVIEKAPTSKFEAVRKKYSTSKMMKASLRQELSSDTLKCIARGLSPL
ncbi:G2/mitotic-specific cyclin-B [Frankliniella fusca]|uniref:G2/mitotic-specific cyclin-B n=1 Tax=Frankliniella fusca TaxID=407009 RepID=A0AAE1LB71_9NEOP|nr:G2/mitotic-specific cyclin-B [Frankliniella fusca]